MLRDGTKKRIIQQLESMPFEEARNRVLLAELGYDLGSPGHEFCLAWLEEKEALLRDEREERTLSISKETNSIARKALFDSRLATRIAISAIILSIIMAIYEIIK